MPFTAQLASENEMLAFAGRLAARLGAGDTILLSGTLGAGKTVFARGLVQALCGDDTEVISPTFMLVQQYESTKGFPVHHYDLYRIERAGELLELGIEEVLGSALVLMEWPEKGEDIWPKDRLEISIELDPENPHARRLQLLPKGSMVEKIRPLFT